MKKNQKRQILAEVEFFPGMSGAAATLLSMLRDPDPSISKIEKVLRRDPGLTANVLKLANSAYFGPSHKVGSVKQAVILLGLKRLFQLVMAASVKSVMEKPVSGYDMPAGELWRHAVGVSVAAELLVKALNIQDSEMALTAALLHDLGKLVMGDFVQADLREIEKMAAKGISFEVAEAFVTGTDHAEVGARILKRWSLPPELVNAVRWHHDPDSAKDSAGGLFADIVHVADVLCLMLGIGVGFEGMHYATSSTVTKRLGLKPFQLEDIASQTLNSVSEMTDVLS
ncbi:MAG: HDOD domain-containing protein [Desulfobacterales bacterium]